MIQRFFFFLSESSFGCSESSRFFSSLNISSNNSLIFILFLADVSKYLTFHIFCNSAMLGTSTYNRHVTHLERLAGLGGDLALARLLVALVADQQHGPALQTPLHLHTIASSLAVLDWWGVWILWWILRDQGKLGENNYRGSTILGAPLETENTLWSNWDTFA